MLAMKCRNLSMNHRKVISWILRQPIIQLAIFIQMKQENNQEKIEQRSSVYWRYTHQNTQHAKALPSVLCKQKAMIHVSEGMKTKASDLDRLTEQIREKKTLGNTTFEEKIKIRTITTESWSIVKAASYFSVSEYLIRQARELKKIHGILRKNRGKPLPASTAEKVQFFYEDDAHSRLMPSRKDFVTIKKMCISKKDSFYATFMSCMYCSKNRTQY